jgi:hypothetical protein
MNHKIVRLFGECRITKNSTPAGAASGFIFNRPATYPAHEAVTAAFVAWT